MTTILLAINCRYCSKKKKEKKKKESRQQSAFSRPAGKRQCQAVTLVGQRVQGVKEKVGQSVQQVGG